METADYMLYMVQGHENFPVMHLFNSSNDKNCQIMIYTFRVQTMYFILFKYMNCEFVFVCFYVILNDIVSERGFYKKGLKTNASFML